jgi:hypothetical protein
VTGLWVLAASSAAAASAACPTVEVLLEGAPQEIARRVRTELDVELQRETLCEQAGTATVTLSWREGGSVDVSVNATRDGVDRQFHRRVESSEVPRDGLALTLAAVAAELLSELNRPTAAAPPTEEQPAEPAPDSTKAELVARAAAEMWSGGHAQVGGELALRLALFTRLEMELSLGGRGGISRTVDAGVVHSEALSVSISALPLLVRGDAVHLAAEAGLAGGPIWFTGALTMAGVLISARGGLELSLNLSHAVLALRAGVDVPLRGIAAAQGDRVLFAASGVGGYVSLGGGYTW